MLERDRHELKGITYPRQVVNENKSYGTHVFCDSSKKVFGFVTNAYTNERESS